MSGKEFSLLINSETKSHVVLEQNGRNTFSAEWVHGRNYFTLTRFTYLTGETSIITMSLEDLEKLIAIKEHLESTLERKA